MPPWTIRSSNSAISPPRRSIRRCAPRLSGIWRVLGNVSPDRRLPRGAVLLGAGHDRRSRPGRLRRGQSNARRHGAPAARRGSGLRFRAVGSVDGSLRSRCRHDGAAGRDRCRADVSRRRARRGDEPASRERRSSWRSTSAGRGRFCEAFGYGPLHFSAEPSRHRPAEQAHGSPDARCCVSRGASGTVDEAAGRSHRRRSRRHDRYRPSRWSRSAWIRCRPWSYAAASRSSSITTSRSRICSVGHPFQTFSPELVN